MNDDTIIDDDTAVRDEIIIAEAPCSRCGLQTNDFAGSRIFDGRLLCAGCRVLVCRECGRETSDVMRRAFAGHPALCTDCTARRPGRAWMAGAGPGSVAADSDAPVEDVGTEVVYCDKEEE
jgi:hypothetical protein